MRELECKLKYDASEKERICACCEKKGMKKEYDALERDIYYVDRDGSIEKEDRALRLRCRTEGEESRFFLCCKGPNRCPGVQDREEAETGVDSPAAVNSILNTLGCYSAARVEKRRICYKKNALSIYLDEVSGLGSFIEIEIMSEDASAEDLEDIKAQLGLRSAESISETYLDLILKNKA